MSRLEAETPQESAPSSRRKLRNWLLLLSMITAALVGLVWWKSQTERLRFVEPIWSDSLVGHEHDAATGQRRKIGEVWSVSRSSGFAMFGRGLSVDFEGRYPVFTPANSFQRSVSEQSLAELRDGATDTEVHDWAIWWSAIKNPIASNRSGFRVSWEVLFVSKDAVSLRQRVLHHEGGTHESYGSSGKNFVVRNGECHKVQVDELFHDTNWQGVISSLCLSDLEGQGVSLIGTEAHGEQNQELRMRLLTTHISQGTFAIMPDGLRWYFPPYMVEPNSGVEYEVFIPFEKLAEHLRPDGPHRLFQTKVSE